MAEMSSRGPGIFWSVMIPISIMFDDASDAQEQCQGQRRISNKAVLSVVEDHIPSSFKLAGLPSKSMLLYMDFQPWYFARGPAVRISADKGSTKS